MNLLFDATSLNVARKDGLNRYIESLLLHLNRDELSKNTSLMISDNINIDINKIIHNNILHSTDFRALLSRYFNQFFKLFFSAKNYDILYFPLPEGTIFKRENQKQIVTIHDLLPVEYPEVFPKVKYHFKYILPKILKNTDLIITVSDFTAQRVREFYNYKGKIETIYQGYRDDIFYKRNDLEIKKIKEKYALSEKYIITVGETRKYKNTMSLIKSFQYINSNIKLAVVGKINRLDNETVNLAKKLGIEDKIIFLDFVSDDDLASLYSGANAFTFMSLYEGFGIPVLEAMACGTPLILSDIAPFKEIATDLATFCNPTDYNDIADKIELVVNRDNSDLIEKGFERVKHFTWNKFLNKFKKVISSL